jgi:hypothetical protein
MSNNVHLQRRSAAAVFFLPLITFGIYSIVWYAKTRGEVNASGAKVMTTWWILCPLGLFWYLWSLAKGVQVATGLGTGGNYALLLLLGSIGQTVVQARMNGASRGVSAAASAPVTV